MNKLPEDFKQKWVAALRSGEYKQGKASLYSSSDDAYCCLGVACYIYNGVRPTYTGYMPDGGSGYHALPKAISGGFTNANVIELVRMNDERRLPFSKIADWIEQNL